MSRFGNLEFGERRPHEVRQQELACDEGLQAQAAEEALRRGDFELALRAFARVLESNPQNPHAWVGQVRMLIELGDFEEAKNWADQAAARFPREPEVLAAKAVALARTGDLKAALLFSDAAIEERGDTPYIWLARGDVLLARKERRADYCFSKALAVTPRDWLWPWLASRIHSWYRRFSVALRLISQALALDGAQAVIWLQMGRCQMALGLASAAADSFDQARQLDPRCPALGEALADLRNVSWWHRWLGWWRRGRPAGS
ncbi:MAG: tetratricopeptide repeat protein [Verrucomicrobia bacterium]|nr:tetratricopeptide repeat protein [Verrucomicrobiota bacterium]